MRLEGLPRRRRRRVTASRVGTVNHGTATGEQLLALARQISASVLEKFGVPIEPEPRLIGAQW